MSLDGTNDILCVGQNNFGQLGIGNNVREFQHNVPVRFGLYSDGSYLIPQDVKDIQCGGNFTLVLKNDGKVHCCGSINGNVIPYLMQITIPYPSKCVQISCGRKHSLALLEGNYVISWGTGYFGQLGMGDDNSSDTPRMITSLNPERLGCRVVKVVCGGSHSGVVTDSGRVFMWGFNRSSQCGIGIKSDSICDPKPIDLSELPPLKASSLVCGRNHTAMLTTDGRVYTWGAGSYGRLGIIDAKKKQMTPCEVVRFRLQPVYSLAAGDFHTLALTHDSSVYSWGYNHEGQCGLHNIQHVKVPTRIGELDDCNIIGVSCGTTWSNALSKSGDLFVWGYGDGGWLCHEKPTDKLPEFDPEVSTDEFIPHAQISTFDALFNVIIPMPVTLLSNYHIDNIRCGGGHSILFTKTRSDNTSRTRRISMNNRKRSLVNLEPSEHLNNEKNDDINEVFIDKKNSSNSNSSRNITSNERNDSTEESSSYNHTQNNDVNYLMTKIHSWVRHKKVAELSYALAKGVDVNCRDSYGNTPLIIACQNGHDAISHLLVDHGASINECNYKGNTALHFCFAYTFDELGKFLIAHGADEYATNLDGLTCYEGMSKNDLDSI